MNYIGFKNGYYQPSWVQNKGYENGSAYANPDGSWTVYDGKQNYMGKVGADGSFTYNGAVSEYKVTFLCAAADALE